MTAPRNPTGRPSGRSTLWSKGTHTDDWVIQFTVGDDYRWDNVLLPFDIRATRAHVGGLRRIGVLTDEEGDRIERALDQLQEAWNAGDIRVEVSDEDCHTVIERFITEQTGSIGGKVHTGRSRNDQVLAALRLFERDALLSLASSGALLASNAIERAAESDTWLMPGYTHTQRAMPSTLGLWFAGYAECVIDDAEELLHAAERVNRSPLGSGAGYGIPHVALDRPGVADELFDGALIHNSTAVQLGRGKAEAIAAGAAAQLMLTLNRLSADLILFASAEFGFVAFSDVVATGSSIMPHKKNPDVLEVARAAFHRVVAEQNLLLSVGANLGSGYHRDLQVTKGAIMQVLLLTQDTVDALRRMLDHVSFDRERMDAAVTPEMLTAGNALREALAGRPFREAYRDNQGAVTRPSANEILATYRTPGAPGHAALEPLNERLERVRNRLSPGR